MPLFVANGYPIRSCTNCGHRYAEFDAAANHVAQVYDDSYFNAGGAGYANYLAEAQLLREHGERYGRILARWRQPGRILDVGAAAGFLLDGFRAAGWSVTGVEPNAAMGAYARAELGIDVRVGTLETFADTEKFDAIAMIQVVAHFFDLRQAFERAGALVERGGLLLVETWNRESLTARMLGKHWHEYSPPSVLHLFSPADLGALARQFGFEPLARGRPRKFILGSHAKSLLTFKAGESSLGKVMRALGNVIPDGTRIPYPAEDLFWSLYRKG